MADMVKSTHNESLFLFDVQTAHCGWLMYLGAVCGSVGWMSDRRLAARGCRGG